MDRGNGGEQRIMSKRIDQRKPFDPDAGEDVANSMSAHDLAVRLMREIKETPSSQYQTLVGKAIQQVTDWEPEWNEIELLIDRVAEEPLEENE